MPVTPPARPLARWLHLGGPGEVARTLQGLGYGGEALAWARRAARGLVQLDGLAPGDAAALQTAAGRLGLPLAAAGERAVVAAAPAERADLAAALRAGAPQLAEALGGLPEPDAAPPPLRAGPYTLPFGHRTYVMAIVNVTPDSFSEELGYVPGVDETVARVRQAVAEGADIVDIGAESSEARDRGGEPEEAEIARLLPVLERLGDLPVPVSVDTRRARVAEAALRAGAHMINDVDALRSPELAAVCARHACPVVVMHNPDGGGYRDLMGDIAAALRAAVDRARAAGVAETQIVVDAGFGFGKGVAEDVEHTRRLAELRCLGRPILHAPSRKRTIGRVLGFPESIPERLPGTAAAVALGIAAGADIVRVHDVQFMVRVARMADAIVRGAAGRRWGDLP
jgi:dihydropteroate synthase